jgi:hypothetical protein
LVLFKIKNLHFITKLLKIFLLTGRSRLSDISGRILEKRPETGLTAAGKFGRPEGQPSEGPVPQKGGFFGPQEISGLRSGYAG